MRRDEAWSDRHMAGIEQAIARAEQTYARTEILIERLHRSGTCSLAMEEYLQGVQEMLGRLWSFRSILLRRGNLLSFPSDEASR